MKKLIITLFIAIFPLTASAAWYDFLNPTNWFSRGYEAEEQAASVVIPPREESIENAEPSTTTPEIIEVKEVVEVPVETTKEVVKTETVTVQDPALIARVNQLVAENEELKRKLEEFDINEYIQIEIDHTNLKKKHDELELSHSQCVTSLNSAEFNNFSIEANEALDVIEIQTYELTGIIQKIQKLAEIKEMGAMKSEISSILSHVGSVNQELKTDFNVLKVKIR